MDSRFDYSVRVGYPLERANVNIVIVDLPDGDAQVVAETAEIFIYRIGIGLNLHVARWATDASDRQRCLGSRCCCRVSLGSLSPDAQRQESQRDRKSTRLNSSHVEISYAVFC